MCWRIFNRFETGKAYFVKNLTVNLQIKMKVEKPISPSTSQWRHNGRAGVSNHQTHDCLHDHLFRCRSKKTSKLRVTSLCVGNSPVTGEFPAQKASNAENIFIWWRHHASWVSVTARMSTSVEYSVLPMVCLMNKDSRKRTWASLKMAALEMFCCFSRTGSPAMYFGCFYMYTPIKKIHVWPCTYKSVYIYIFVCVVNVDTEKNSTDTHTEWVFAQG